MQSPFKAFIPLILILVIFSVIPAVFAGTLHRYHIDEKVIIGANILFFLLSIITFSLQQKAMTNKNAHAFVRAVTGAMLLKMIVCVIAVILYVYASGDNFNKRAIFASLVLYLVYLFSEVLIVMKMNKKQHA